MHTDRRNDRRIIDSWHSNAEPWTIAVRAGGIESRRLVTDQAVLDAVMSRAPRTVLDLGCGEGWLCRALAARGVRCSGYDVVPALIEQARRAGDGEFHVASFEQLAAGGCCAPSELAVCNFSLLGRESVEVLLRAMPAILQPRGTLVIQTLHPVFACGEQRYEDGWREGSWLGIDAACCDPAPWYFRTLESWVRLLHDSGMRLLELREPRHPSSLRPASVIFIAAPA